MDFGHVDRTYGRKSVFRPLWLSDHGNTDRFAGPASVLQAVLCATRSAHPTGLLWDSRPAPGDAFRALALRRLEFGLFSEPYAFVWHWGFLSRPLVPCRGRALLLTLALLCPQFFAGQSGDLFCVYHHRYPPLSGRQLLFRSSSGNYILCLQRLYVERLRRPCVRSPRGDPAALFERRTPSNAESRHAGLRRSRATVGIVPTVRNLDQAESCWCGFAEFSMEHCIRWILATVPAPGHEPIEVFGCQSVLKLFRLHQLWPVLDPCPYVQRVRRIGETFLPVPRGGCRLRETLFTIPDRKCRERCARLHVQTLVRKSVLAT